MWSAVKELVENAIDAHATHIEVINMLSQNSGGEYMTYMAIPVFGSLLATLSEDFHGISVVYLGIDIPPAGPQY